MALEVDNLPAFGRYCSEVQDEQDLHSALECAERWGGFIVKASKQYGGPIEQNVKLALDYAQKTPEADGEYDGPRRIEEQIRYDTKTVLHASEILANFWTHKDGVRKWLAGQAIATLGIEPPRIIT